WTEAIEESGLSWQKLTEERSAQLPLDQPLPWDHINTGIDKEWLKTEWQRSQSAITIEDCSFDSCSRCGVCGPEFGHNIIVPPLPIPAFVGESAPNQQRVQRLRVWFGKLGDMALISHLDLVRLLDRAMRRAGLPISFSGGFHPTPRIAIASALSLGVTSSGEILDIELTEKLELSEFQARLAEKLPVGLPLYQVTEIEINSPAVNHLLDQAEYLITVAMQKQVSDKPDTQEAENTENTEMISESLIQPLWQDWINDILNQTSIIWQQRTKSGKIKTVNLREILANLEFVGYATDIDVSLDKTSAENIIKAEDVTEETAKQIAVLRYVGSYKQEGGLLKPEHITYMLEQVVNQKNLAYPLEFQLLHIHRTKLYLQ
ncbi:MAG: TIGR03936 family radical SAM-associated protein, partial [Microcoleaceae cyanobacterium]